jgi:membrane protein YqaA with SNARE-associated domain
MGADPVDKLGKFCRMPAVELVTRGGRVPGPAAIMETRLLVSTAYVEPTRSTAAPTPGAVSRLRRWAPFAASLLLTLAAAPIGVVLAERFDDLAAYAALGYPSLFLIQMLTSATLFLPAPGAALAMAAGTVWDPVWVGVVAGLGSATGELTGYGLGYFGRQAAPIDRSRCWRLAERGFRRWGLVALFVLAVIPNPVFDALGILAGCLRYPVLRYWLATAAGKIVKFGSLAYLAEIAATWMRVAM